ncbi:MAG: exo-alpha-sialidase [Oscillospiraceae bacterium]|nr:exo-alpha-sialidase [Oscillospiraceae bacterium]
MLITDPVELKRFEACRRAWQGIPGMVRTPGGRTFVSFYSGGVKEEYSNFAAVIMSDNDTDFSEPVAVLEKDGDYRCFDPVLWLDPMGRLWLVWNVMPGEEVHAVICAAPDAETIVWGEERLIGRGIMMNKPTVLSSGVWLFPIATWKLDLMSEMRKPGLLPDETPGSYVWVTSDCGETFTRLGFADVPDRCFDEQMVLELNDGRLMMLVRTYYGIGVSYSSDGGKSWTPGEDSGLGGPCSRFFLRRLRSGRVLLINHFNSPGYNNRENFAGRNNLTALLSEDDGKTYPYTLLLDERFQVSYPDGMECDDGFIYIVYDRERGAFRNNLEEIYGDAREILTARFTEEDIIAGALVTEGSWLKKVICKLGRLADDMPDPFTL